ncbi:FCSD flavin-binding domain-containing protein [Rhodospirillum sp. A1_3_36]|uniref:FCSD flavin-binding domain-containing protein n=1 Tax=Rhodospirillum sp. A1_3_36 TaxID=3391666 RepID=UPI0039A64E59
MTKITRRTLGRWTLAALSVGALRSRLARAAGKPRVVVLGGGAGGASAARRVAELSQGAVDVTLIERSARYTSCFFSNHYLGGLQSLETLVHDYDQLHSRFGIKTVTASATAIDRDARMVVLEGGERVPYDRLILSPGIDMMYDSLPGYSEEAAQVAPHAWRGGEQLRLLKAKLDAVEDGQTVIMVPPPNPYRCPPAPYERASMMAHLFKAKGFSNTRIIILDPKPSFPKQRLFDEGWSTLYPGMIEWYGPGVHGGVIGVDVVAGSVETDFDTFEGDLLTLIPAQRAGGIARDAGLADGTGFCPIEAETMRSRVDAGIYVLGDSAIAGDMPKGAFAANSQAQVAALAVLADLTERARSPASYANTCWSVIEENDAVKEGGRYAPLDGRITATHHVLSQPGESPDVRRANAEEAAAWYAAIVSDMFGYG